VREGFDARVWIVSPTTCMATLNTMRAVMKDARMREQAGEIRKALRLLHRDVEIIEERAGKLETHLRQAGDDVAGLLTASARAGKRAERLDHFDFEELSPDMPEHPRGPAAAAVTVQFAKIRIAPDPDPWCFLDQKDTRGSCGTVPRSEGPSPFAFFGPLG
jgi:DNA anti-recombination protein RmuC